MALSVQINGSNCKTSLFLVHQFRFCAQWLFIKLFLLLTKALSMVKWTFEPWLYWWASEPASTGIKYSKCTIRSD